MQPFLALITPLAGGASAGGPVDPGYSPPWAQAPGQAPGQPPRPWGPIFYPDQGLPGPQPGQPPRPWGPIFYPDQGLPVPPNLPPTLPDPDNRPIDWKAAWTPATGWVVVGIPQGNVPTPSGAAKPRTGSGSPTPATPPKT